jgi:hypothetical protein
MAETTARAVPMVSRNSAILWGVLATFGAGLGTAVGTGNVRVSLGRGEGDVAVLGQPGGNAVRNAAPPIKTPDPSLPIAKDAEKGLDKKDVSSEPAATAPLELGVPALEFAPLLDEKVDRAEWDATEGFAKVGLIQALKNPTEFSNLFSRQVLIKRALWLDSLPDYAARFLFDPKKSGDVAAPLRGIFEPAHNGGSYTLLRFEKRSKASLPTPESPVPSDVGGEYLALYRMMNKEQSAFDYLVYGIETFRDATSGIGARIFRIVDVFSCQRGELLTDSIRRDYILEYHSGMSVGKGSRYAEFVAAANLIIELGRALEMKDHARASSLFRALPPSVQNDQEVRLIALVAAYNESLKTPAVQPSPFATFMESLRPNDAGLQLPTDTAALLQGIDGWVRLKNPKRAADCLTLFKRLLRLAETVAEKGKDESISIDPYLSVIRARINEASSDPQSAVQSALNALETSRKMTETAAGKALDNSFDNAFWNLILLSPKDPVTSTQTVEGLKKLGFADPKVSSPKQADHEKQLLEKVKLNYPFIHEKLKATPGFTDLLPIASKP